MKMKPTEFLTMLRRDASLTNTYTIIGGEGEIGRGGNVRFHGSPFSSCDDLNRALWAISLDASEGCYLKTDIQMLRGGEVVHEVTISIGQKDDTRFEQHLIRAVQNFTEPYGCGSDFEERRKVYHAQYSSILGMVEDEKGTMAEPIPGLIRVLSREELPNGVSVMKVPCEGFQSYKALPIAIRYEGKDHAITGFNTDLGVAYYRDDAMGKVAEIIK